MPTTVAATPTISGQARVEATLTASNDGGSNGAPAPSYGYQWERCSQEGASCTAIAGATATSYALTDADVGHVIRVAGEASNASYAGGDSAQATSAATGVVVAIPASDETVPSIAGSSYVGRTIQAAPGTWAGDPTPLYGYQWQLCSTTGT